MVPQPLAKTSAQDEVLERIFCECLTQFAQKAQQQDLHTNVVNRIFVSISHHLLISGPKGPHEQQALQPQGGRRAQ